VGDHVGIPGVVLLLFPSTTVGDHVGIPGVVLLLFPHLPLPEPSGMVAALEMGSFSCFLCLSMLYMVYFGINCNNPLWNSWCLKILAGYGVGPNLLRLQKKFWDVAKMVCRTGGNYGLPFGAHRGVTLGGPLSSLMFNVCVDCVVREWLLQVLGEDVARDGVGDLVRDHCIAFFVDHGLVAARCPEWLQSSFDILINLFEWIGLRTNAEKTKVMTCLPGKIRVAKTEEEYASQQTGLGTAATKR
jgi:hypothetical protein